MFPAVVVLHGCDGVGAHYRAWARRIADWGYAALLVDSFTTRGRINVCNHGMDVPPLDQAADAFAAADWLRTRPFIQPDRIGVIGFSHGGWAVLKAVLGYAATNHHPFAAAVAFYPGCERPATPLVTDTLILIGDTDDWTPAARCVAWRNAVRTDGHVVDIHVYPGAVHAFDWPGRRSTYAGHQVGGDPVAGPDAIARAHAFFEARLQTGNAGSHD